MTKPQMTIKNIPWDMLSKLIVEYNILRNELVEAQGEVIRLRLKNSDLEQKIQDLKVANG